MSDPIKPLPMPRLLGGSVCLVFYVVVLSLLFRHDFTEAKDIFLILVGAITTVWTALMMYYLREK